MRKEVLYEEGSSIWGRKFYMRKEVSDTKPLFIFSLSNGATAQGGPRPKNFSKGFFSVSRLVVVLPSVRFSLH